MACFALEFVCALLGFDEYSFFIHRKRLAINGGRYYQAVIQPEKACRTLMLFKFADIVEYLYGLESTWLIFSLAFAE